MLKRRRLFKRRCPQLHYIPELQIGPFRKRTIASMKLIGPACLWVTWAAHDVEEAIAFPAMCKASATKTGIKQLNLTPAQSWATVGIMGLGIAVACIDGYRTEGRSKAYRAVVAGLGAHVFTHIAASVALHRYTPGVITALPLMLPGTIIASAELRNDNEPLQTNDYIHGTAILLPAAIACHILARLIKR